MTHKNAMSHAIKRGGRLLTCAKANNYLTNYYAKEHRYPFDIRRAQPEMMWVACRHALAHANYEEAPYEPNFIRWDSSKKFGTLLRVKESEMLPRWTKNARLRDHNDPAARARGPKYNYNHWPVPNRLLIYERMAPGGHPLHPYVRRLKCLERKKWPYETDLKKIRGPLLMGHRMSWDEAWMYAYLNAGELLHIDEATR